MRNCTTTTFVIVSVEAFRRDGSVVLEVVNGLGAHGVYAAGAALRRGARPPSLLVVHESPRHFAPGSRLSGERALEIVRSYDYRVFVSQRGRAEWNALGLPRPVTTYERVPIEPGISPGRPGEASIAPLRVSQASVPKCRSCSV